jgi:hydrogenase small subunit
MPGFPDKVMPFMDEPPGGSLSSMILSNSYGPTIRRLRAITNNSLNREPKWRRKGPALTTGYDPRFTLKARQGGDHED